MAHPHSAVWRNFDWHRPIINSPFHWCLLGFSSFLSFVLIQIFLILYFLIFYPSCYFLSVILIFFFYIFPLINLLFLLILLLLICLGRPYPFIFKRYSPSVLFLCCLAASATSHGDSASVTLLSLCPAPQRYLCCSINLYPCFAPFFFHPFNFSLALSAVFSFLFFSAQLSPLIIAFGYFGLAYNYNNINNKKNMNKCNNNNIIIIITKDGCHYV